MSKKKQIRIEEAQKEYERIKPILQAFELELSDEINTLILNNSIKLGFPIQHRVKSWSSIKEKLERGVVNIAQLIELQDLVGLRILLLYQRDLKQIQDIINNTFTIIREYDTLSRLKEDQFGYSSIHMIIKLPSNWLAVPSLSRFGDFYAEIQLRTLTQHLWAEVSHELQYKSEKDVPSPLLRSIYRASALLETVDLEFERLLSERIKYRDRVENPLEEELNVDIIEKILDAVLPSQNKVIDEDYAELREIMITHGINTPKELEEFVKKYLDVAIKADKKYVAKEIEFDRESKEGYRCPVEDWPRIDKGYYFTHTGLVRMMLEGFDKKESS